MKLESKDQIQNLGKTLQAMIGNSVPYKAFKYPFCNVEHCIFVTELDDFEGYKCFISTNYLSGTIFVYLSDSETNEACHLLASLVAAVKSGKTYSAEQVISLSDNYLGSKGFNSLMFFEPEDFELFGNLKSTFSVDGRNVTALSLIPLKSNEFADYKQRGIDAIIELLDSESRDFLSVN